MRAKLVHLLLLVPFFSFGQFINTPDNYYPVYTFNLFQQTDHTTDVFNYYGDATHTGFYIQESEFWGFDVVSSSNVLFATLTDLNSDQAFFATNHDNMGVLTWFVTSEQLSSAGGGYGTSKMMFNPGTGNYLFCTEYWAPFPGYPQEFLSSSSGPFATASTDLFGLMVLEVDAAGNILTICEAFADPNPVRLGDIDVDPSSGYLYITATRDNGGAAQAFVIEHDVITCTTLAGQADGAGVNSWGRGIDVENAQVYVVGDYESSIDWGGATGSSSGSQDVYVVQFDASSGMAPVAISVADAANYAEGYDVEVYNNNQNIYVSGSIQENSLNWNMGNFGPAPPGALHGFIQLFSTGLVSTCNYVHVIANNPNEFFKMVDMEENIAPVTGFNGLIDIGGNLRDFDPTITYDFFTGCALSASYTFDRIQEDMGFVLRVNDHPEPVWDSLSVLRIPIPGHPAPTVTAVSSFEEDIFVGGYKNEDVLLNPSFINDIIPNLGNSLMNAYFTYIFAPFGATQGDFYKTAPTAVVQEAESGAVQFAVYPNPVNDVLYIRLDDAASLQQVLLKDLAGRTVQGWSGEEAAGGLSVGDIPAGVYLMEIESNGLRATERVVIQ